MTLCGEASLVKSDEDESYAKKLHCRSWNCDCCESERTAQLIARAIGGEPDRFLTLTVNPAVGESPADRRKMLSHAWNVLVKRIRRAHPKDAIDYFVVTEATKRGEPHLHILLRSPYLAHSMLSEAMAELASAPIVDIRKIRGRKEIAAYVAKYIAKAPEQFGTAKRYWTSRTWDIPAELPAFEIPLPGVKWSVVFDPLDAILTRWARAGVPFRVWNKQTMVAFHPNRGPP